ncbi:MAG: peptidoglycan DD-metalloendopeptidase family protein [Nannocystaceae bacterium]
MSNTSHLPGVDTTTLDRPAPTTKSATKQTPASAAIQFESLVLSELMKVMRATVPQDKEGHSFGLEVAQSLCDQAISDAGAGALGLHPIIARELGGTSEAVHVAQARWGGSITESRVHAPSRSMPRSRYGTFHSAIPGPGEMPTEGIVSSKFGWRTHPTRGRRSFHEGLDIAAPTGTEVTAVQAGRVRFAGRKGSYGNLVELAHADGSLTRYAHASRLFVRAGDRVEVGETIADVGASGRATGPHLHFEAIVNDKPVDPERYLNALRQHDDGTDPRPAGTTP